MLNLSIVVVLKIAIYKIQNLSVFVVPPYFPYPPIKRRLTCPPLKYMTETLDATAVAQNNVALSNEQVKFNFDKVRTYEPEQREREGLIVIAPMNSFARAGVQFSPVKRNVNGTKYVTITLPNGKSGSHFFSKALSANPLVEAGMKATELDKLCMVSQNKGVDTKTGEEIEYFRFERKGVLVDEADNALLAQLGL
jgi:hypothetical protein